MNQFYFESRGKEKVREFMNEGMSSQLQERSSIRKSSVFSRIVKLGLIVLSIWGIAQLLVG